MLSALLNIKKGLTLLLNIFLIVIVLLLVADVVWGVGTRYILGEQANWTEELARFLLVWVSLLGAAVAFGTKGHLGIDFFVNKLHPDARKLTAIFAHIVVLFFAIAIFIYGGSCIVKDSLDVQQMTPALGWKMGYIYLALPVSGIFMLIFTIENLIETILTPSDKLDLEAAGEDI
jgi:TRAP-type C4-dicarboxylate transport system permease small subunit